ncbi:MAG: ABC transporter permease [Candidatus Bathyarchaeota archaeon]|nr:ABC transporter permease [Candidatus Bathyarchaeota archaeon]
MNQKSLGSTQASNRLAKLSNKIIVALLILIFVTYLVFIALPIIAVFLRIDPSQVSAQLQNGQIIEAIQLSLFTSAIATGVSIVLTVPTAYFMVTRKFPGKSILDTLIDLPIVLPPAVAGVALLLAFAPKGLLGPILNSLNLTIPGSTIAVILAQIFVASPFILRSAKTGFENVSQDLINSAKILSDSKLRVFLTVTLPLSTSVIISGVMMTWARALGEFGATIMFAGNVPGVTQTMPLSIYVLMNSTPLAGVMLSTVLIVISFSILIIIKYVEQKRSGGKKKE